MRSTNSFNIEMKNWNKYRPRRFFLHWHSSPISHSWPCSTIMAFLRLCFLVLGAGAGQVLSMNDPNWLLSEMGVAARSHKDSIPPQAQVIDQRTFNVLHNVRPASEAHGYAVGTQECAGGSSGLTISF
jgi:hypothetical protein